MLRALYDRTLRLSSHRHAGWALAGVSFIESSFFPIPPDVMLIPMVLADRAKAWRYAFLCTMASVLGALLGYAIGCVFWEAIGQPIVGFYNADAAFVRFTEFYDIWGIWIVLAAAISFLPFKIATIASGVSGLALAPFLITSLIGRGIRFFAVAALVYYFGPGIRRFIDRYFNVLSLTFIAVLLLGFLLLGAV
ncbi:MAG: DedA family protein [PS1 clade bacterium]|uniref:DedA family protein n=1 Tax=PS1 clade bacterium TaxID=2175152 RepID=A0A937L389_9PROT|nr:DedA family protein [PS1 clade bacterium]